MYIRRYLGGLKVTRINSTRLLKPFRNIVHHTETFCTRYGFWNLRQEDDESIDAYLTRIKIKIDMCEYTREGWPPTVREECDKFVLGLIDDKDFSMNQILI